MAALLSQVTGWMHTRTAKLAGHVLASVSLLSCLLFWLALLYAGASETVLIDLTGFQWLEIMGIAVIFAFIAAVFRSKLSWVALPIALIMFLFTMYVMGT
jgi:hypothetical protein